MKWRFVERVESSQVPEKAFSHTVGVYNEDILFDMTTAQVAANAPLYIRSQARFPPARILSAPSKPDLVCNWPTAKTENAANALPSSHDNTPMWKANPRGDGCIGAAPLHGKRNVARGGSSGGASIRKDGEDLADAVQQLIREVKLQRTLVQRIAGKCQIC